MSLEKKLQNRFKSNFKVEGKMYYLEASLHEQVQVLVELKDSFSFIFFLDFFVRDLINEKGPKRFEVNYILLSMGEEKRINVAFKVDEGEKLHSLNFLWKPLAWYEREAKEMYGVYFIYSHCKPLLTGMSEKKSMHPMRKDWKNNYEDFNFDIQKKVFDDLHYVRAELSESRFWTQLELSQFYCDTDWKVFVEVEEEKIQRSFVDVGYNHLGIEKIAENGDIVNFGSYIEQLNQNAKFMGSFLWCYSIEELFDIQISDRSKTLRMIFKELGRIHDHICLLRKQLSLVKSIELISHCNEVLITINLIFRSYLKNKNTQNLFVIGGMASDVNSFWVIESLEQIEKIEKNINTITNILNNNTLWMESLTTGEIPVKDAFHWSFSGPTLRASGVNYDIRKSSPYYFYSDVNFEVPLGVKGDNYDRYLVRIREVEESLKIVEQLLDNLPLGKVFANKDLYGLSRLKNKTKVLRELSSNTQRKRVYTSIESSNGELGVSIILNESDNVERVHLRTPSYVLAQSFPELVKGKYYAYALPILMSLNISVPEIDR